MDVYIAKFPVSVQAILQEIRKTLKNISPNTVQETIKYGIPTLVLNGKNIVHFSGNKYHIGFYPTPSAILIFTDRLQNYKTSKGAIQFPIDKKNIPYDLISDITLFRINEIKNNAKQI